MGRLLSGAKSQLEGPKSQLEGAKRRLEGAKRRLEDAKRRLLTTERPEAVAERAGETGGSAVLAKSEQPCHPSEQFAAVGFDRRQVAKLERGSRVFDQQRHRQVKPIALIVAFAIGRRSELRL